MKNWLAFFIVLLAALSFVACGNDNSDTTEPPENPCKDINQSQALIQGTAQYQLPTFSAANGLNLASPTISNKPIRQAIVVITNSAGTCNLGSGNTNNSGAFTIVYNSGGVANIKIRITASIGANSSNNNFSANTNTLVSVVDNTSSGALYALVKEESVSTVFTGTVTAPVANSGSGAFAILDIALDAYNLIKTAEPGVQFTTLPINWSINNAPVAGNLNAGQIGTSFWNGSALYILGQANVDADEFDTAVVGHEFGHYVESTLFRSDSIGGSHSGGQDLDLRVAFGEGFGNAFGSIVRNDPVYFDTSGTNMTTVGVNLNLENGATAGVSSAANEVSVQKILWDLYDATADTNDNLSLGFSNIYTALRSTQKNTPALTTLISFAAAIQAGGNNPSQIISNEFNGNTNSVNVIGMDHFAQGGIANKLNPSETCRGAAYAFVAGNTVGATADSLNFTTPGGGSGFNKYCSTMYYKYAPTISANRTFQLSGLTANCDIDLYIYQGGTLVGSANQGGEGASEARSINVAAGAIYVFEARGYSRGGNALNLASGGPCNFSYSIN